MCLNHCELVLKHPTHLAISVLVWFVYVQCGSMCLNHSELVHKHPCYLCDGVVCGGSMRFNVLEPQCISTLHTLLSRDGVVRVGSMRFDVLEPSRTRGKAPYTPCSLVMVWFVYRSMCLNNPELVHKHPTHLAILTCA